MAREATAQDRSSNSNNSNNSSKNSSNNSSNNNSNNSTKSNRNNSSSSNNNHTQLVLLVLPPVLVFLSVNLLMRNGSSRNRQSTGASKITSSKIGRMLLA